MNPDMTLGSLSSFVNKSEKLGVTTNLVSEVETMEVLLEDFAKHLQLQRTQSEELDAQLHRLEEGTLKDQSQTLDKANDQVQYLLRFFAAENLKQRNQFEYLQLQAKSLSEEQEKLQELTRALMQRNMELQRQTGI